MVIIQDVKGGSLADIAGIMPDDYIVSVNDNNINDVLDYSYYMAEKHVTLKIHRGPELFDIDIVKGRYQDVGLEFKTFLMDEKKSCTNKCVFCFIDQLPSGMRDTLYFKDDDSRLTFISGTYITMTNMDEHDISRIIKMKISPINISVHTTNPELRIQMLNNRFAGNIMSIMKRFAEAGISMNCQVVLCKGINDGIELDRTMNDLAQLHPQVSSVSIVPAGLTKYRQNLYNLVPYTQDDCIKIVTQVEKFAEICYHTTKSRLFYCGDELYIKADLLLHNEHYYDGYPQLENGVGMITSMLTEFSEELRNTDNECFKKYRNISIATGESAYNFICAMVEKLTKLCYDFNCRVYKIRNDFFGENITVAGLLTGQDIINQLRGKDLGAVLYLPLCTLRHEGDVFLDDTTIEDVSTALNVKVEFLDNNGADFVRTLLA